MKLIFKAATIRPAPAAGARACHETMNVTFPDYVKLMKSIGANMELLS